MNEIKRHKLVYKLLCPPVALFSRWFFHYSYDSLKEVEGPYLLLANHNLELDPLVVGAAAGKQLYFVASEHITRKGIGTWLLMTLFKPIIHQKGRQGMNTVKQMMKTLKDGHSVCIFPEGNRSFNGLTGEFLPSIGKMARRSGAKLITYRVEGGYFTQPRWSMTLRRGKMTGRLIHEYTVEELKTMTDPQLHEAICKDLYEDAYETQKRERVAFRGKRLAEGLETTIFTCPVCGKVGTLHSQDSRFYCDCGFETIYDVYGDLTDASGCKYTVTQLDAMQKEVLARKVEEGTMEEFKDEDLTFYEIGEDHELLGTKTGSLSADAQGLTVCGEHIPYSEVQGMAIYSRNCVILHVKGNNGHVEIKSERNVGFSALKYLYLYEICTQSAKEKVS